MNKMFLIKRLYQFKTFDLTKIEQEKIEELEGEEKQELMLSGVLSFAYSYIPGVGTINPTNIGDPIDFDLINTVMKATAQTELLKTEESYRANPFLP